MNFTNLPIELSPTIIIDSIIIITHFSFDYYLILDFNNH